MKKKTQTNKKHSLPKKAAYNVQQFLKIRPNTVSQYNKTGLV